MKCPVPVSSEEEAAQIKRTPRANKLNHCKNYGEKFVKILERKFMRTKRSAFLYYIWFYANRNELSVKYSLIHGVQTHILASKRARKLFLYPLCNVYGYLKCVSKDFASLTA
jgi:hypothetical protein